MTKYTPSPTEAKPGKGGSRRPAPVSPASPEAPPETFRFREVVFETDGDRVREIVSSTGFFHAAEIDIAAELVAERLSRGTESGYCFVFLEEGGRVSGYSCFGPVPGTLASFDLYWIAVHRDRQGAGRGRILLARTEERIRQAGGRRLYAETSGRPQYRPTRRFYRHAGFRREARLRDFYAPGDDKLIFVKELSPLSPWPP